MSRDKMLKAALVAVVAGLTSYSTREEFPLVFRGYAAVGAATAAALLAYLLDPKGPGGPPAPVTVVNGPDEPVPVEDAK